MAYTAWQNKPEILDNSQEAQFVYSCAEEALNVGSYMNSGKTNGGEVYTPRFIVVAMTNMQDDKVSDINSRYLDMCCGTGNFVIEAYIRRLITVLKLKDNFIENLYTALSNTYAIDISDKSIAMCLRRLKMLVTEFITRLVNNGSLPADIKDDVLTKCYDIIDYHILCGTAESMRYVK